MIIYQHINKSNIINGITKAFLLESNLYYEKMFNNYIKADIKLKMKIGLGISICSKNDNYNRKLGRALSTSRIKDELCSISHIKVCDKFITFYLYSNTYDFYFKLRFMKDFSGSPRILHI